MTKAVRRGDKIGGNFSATEWNAVRTRSGRAAFSDLSATSQVAGDGGLDGIVQVVNQTGGYLNPGGVVALDAPRILPTTNRAEWANVINFQGVTPTEEYRGRFGIVLDGAEPQAICPAVVSGPAWCKLRMLSPADQYADILEDSTAMLVSGGVGAAQILHHVPAGETYPQDTVGYVRLSNRPLVGTLKRFQLTANLALGGEANARLLEWDDSANEYVMVGETIVVKDFTENPGSWIAGEGFQGWCILPDDSDDGKYEIVWMENIARFIEFTLSENMTTSGATASVNEWYDIKQPIADPVTIIDPQGLFRRALSGAKGIAVYDPKRDTYVAIECETKAGWIAGTSTEAMGETETGKITVTVNRYGGSQQDIQDPGSTVLAADPQGIYPRALEGAKCKAVYDAEEDEYVLVECQQMVQRLSGVIPSINSGRGLLFADSYFTVAVSGLEAVTWSPFSQMPVGDEGNIDVYNVHAWSADVGAYFKAEWHAEKERWELYQITARCEDAPEE